MELTHNQGSENDASFAVNNGNEEPHRGFGHIAVMTPDVYAASEEFVKDLKKSLHFYQNLLGMNLLRESHKSDFSLYFLSHATTGSSDKDTYEPVIELTHNHGTEDDDKFSYHNGNTEDNGALCG